MTRNKISIILASLGIILVSLTIILSTYAYFSVKLINNNSEISISTFNENTTIVFNDTSNVTLIDAYTGDQIKKNFSITNTSSYRMYYDVHMNNVVNNFSNKDDLVYDISSNNGVIKQNSIVPDKDENILSNILIEPNSTHTYEMTITFLKTNNDQSNNMGKTFSSNITLVPSSGINVGEYVYKNKTLLKSIILLSNGVFNDELEEKNGIFQTNSSDYGYTIYYFKGDSELNNYLLLNNKCYRILRTNENYGIKIVYSGDYINNECQNNDIIENVSYNTKSDYNAYVGYMYGIASSQNYSNEHKNVISSNIKNKNDEWFNLEFDKKDNKISNNAIYCNNRKTKSFTYNKVLYGNKGYAKYNTGYSSFNNEINTYECNNVNDRFSISNINSNNSLSSSVGLLTYEEIMNAKVDNESFLDSTNNYWTMTPAYFNGNDAYVYGVVNNQLKVMKVSSELGLRPVITLNKDVKLLGGDGSLQSPYVID